MALAQALKLIALDREGLGVVSAHVQDTCVKRADMAWMPRQRRFVVAGMRYDWVGAKTGPAERVASVLRFDRVVKVSHLGLKDTDADAPNRRALDRRWPVQGRWRCDDRLDRYPDPFGRERR